MVKAGRTLTHIGVFQNVGSTTGIVFNGPGVKTCMALARALLTRYTKPS